MVFGYVGVCYQETPLAVRELVSFTDSKKTELWNELEKIEVRQCVVLSTCNRSEIFFFFQSHKITMQQIRQCYEAVFPGVPIRNYMKEMQGEEAMAYLFRVTAGLESLVLGEDQILGQVVEAMDFARTMGHSGKELERIVRDAVTCAKQIKTEYRISEKPLSVSYVGIQMLQKYSGIEGKKVLVIGSGKTAALALTYLVDGGAASILLCSRNTEHARELLAVYPQLTVIEYKDRYQEMAHCEIVVSATASPHLVVKKEEWSRPDNGEMIFLDLATPRDVDARLAEEEGVRVIDMDTLQQIAEKNQKERERLASLCQSLIQQKTEETMEWLRQSRMDTTIENLQKRCQGIVEDSYEYLNRKLSLSHREQKIVKKVLNASLQRLLREPIQELKQLEDDETQREYKKVLEHLFRMEEGEG
ncbi:MAG: glutamyl-tRNA reductase [Eubacterium sp.]|nr:glutamyl-tRNA reductase [Eubacterium sp.]